MTNDLFITDPNDILEPTDEELAQIESELDNLVWDDDEC